MMSLHPEPSPCRRASEANIKSFTDFKGKRFNVGNRLGHARLDGRA